MPAGQARYRLKIVCVEDYCLPSSVVSSGCCPIDRTAGLGAGTVDAKCNFQVY